MRVADRRAVVEQLSEISSGDGALLMATTQFVGEGFDIPGLDTLFLAAPVPWESHLLQVAGRVMRSAEGNHEPRLTITLMSIRQYSRGAGKSARQDTRSSVFLEYRQNWLSWDALVLGVILWDDFLGR